jgi:mRNA interferase RelE/StbE
MHIIIFDKEAEKQLKKIPHRDQVRIIKKIETLTKNPRPEWIIALQGKLSGYYRFRVGDYRVIYEVIDKKCIILILKVAHRSWVYDN